MYPIKGYMSFEESINKLREVIANLKENDAMLEYAYQEMDVFFDKIKLFIEDLKDESFAASMINHLPECVDVTYKVEKFITQEIEPFLVSKMTMTDKLKELESSLQMDNGANFSKKKNISKLRTDLFSIQELLEEKFKLFAANEHINSLEAMLRDDNFDALE